jgi:hypothetical protein
MPALTTISLATAGLGAAGALGSAAIGAGAAGGAADAQKRSQDEMIAFQKEQQQKALEFLAPFRNAGVAATEKLAGLAEPGSELERLTRDQSTEAIQRQLAAQGLLRSTAQGDQLSNLEVGLAQNRAAILQALSGQGANAAAGQASSLGNFGQLIGAGMQASGQAQAQGILGGAQAAMGGISGLNNVIQNTVSSIASQEQAKQLMEALTGRTASLAPSVSGSSVMPWQDLNLGMGDFGFGDLQKKLQLLRYGIG